MKDTIRKIDKLSRPSDRSLLFGGGETGQAALYEIWHNNLQLIRKLRRENAELKAELSSLRAREAG